MNISQYPQEISDQSGKKILLVCVLPRIIVKVQNAHSGKKSRGGNLDKLYTLISL